jgi:hypothetical protein
MGRMPSARSVQLRERLVAALQGAAHPLSTDELREVPPDWLLPWRQGPDVYRQLLALERMGICRRIWPSDVQRPGVINPRCVYWDYTYDETFAKFVSDLDRDESPP